MKVSGDFRRDIENQFANLCETIQRQKTLNPCIFNNLSGARDRLELLSKNSLKRFDDFIEAAKAFDQASKSFGSYLTELWGSVRWGRYDEETEMYEVPCEKEEKK